MEFDELSRTVIDWAIEVHRHKIAKRYQTFRPLTLRVLRGF